jgi:hypothetical protein
VQPCHIWDHVTERLDQLGNRMAADDRKKIEAAFAAKVPRPSRAEYKKLARASAQSIGWDFLSDRQRGALADEADKYRIRRAM